MTTLYVIGDSITYLANDHGAVDMFATKGITATVQGKPGARADSENRYLAWLAACATKPDVLVYALGTNDLMFETFRDTDTVEFTEDEEACLYSVLNQRLSYGTFYAPKVVWINTTERTLKGYYNAGARRINAKMRTLCAQTGYGYVDWNILRAPTTDLIHQKPAGTVMWVDAICAIL